MSGTLMMKTITSVLLSLVAVIAVASCKAHRSGGASGVRAIADEDVATAVTNVITLSNGGVQKRKCATANVADPCGCASETGISDPIPEGKYFKALPYPTGPWVTDENSAQGPQKLETTYAAVKALAAQDPNDANTAERLRELDGYHNNMTKLLGIKQQLASGCVSRYNVVAGRVEELLQPFVDVENAVAAEETRPKSCVVTFGTYLDTDPHRKWFLTNHFENGADDALYTEERYPSENQYACFNPPTSSFGTFVVYLPPGCRLEPKKYLGVQGTHKRFQEGETLWDTKGGRYYWGLPQSPDGTAWALQGGLTDFVHDDNKLGFCYLFSRGAVGVQQ